MRPIFTCPAILAALVLRGVCASPVAAQDNGGTNTTATATPVDDAPFEPMPVRFRLADGVRVSGEITAWDLDGIDGSFGRRAWPEIQHRDARVLLARLVDTRDADDCVDMGEILLRIGLDQPAATDWAERAFTQALAVARNAEPVLDEGTGESVPRAELVEARIEEARGRVELTRIARLEREQLAQSERLRTDSPEGRPWRADPWPELTADERTDATATMRADAARILSRAGLTLEPIETEYFLFYSDMPDRQSRRWAGELDRMYGLLAEQFGLEPGDNVFWGKAVIFVFNERDRFDLVEAEAFGQMLAPWVDGIFHPVGPRVFVNFYRQPDESMFAAVLVHETVHGFMHRYRTPYRLPTWANEGLADYLASILFEGSPVDLERRQKGLSFIRRGADVNAVLDYSYGDDSWPGPDSVGYYVSYLLIELMIRDRGLEFARWVEAVKDGVAWEEALRTEFGTTREQLVERFVRFYRVND